ncbi:hypothetical protein Ae168Ps1_4670c [Pseudonocardia sp. Ae168_Ps1]|uniref:mycothiol transferase n=1 Tax=unclassified Pseudonocardia TaxID=2619320 RepID=UPI000965DFFA|nr:MULTISPECIES: DUF664 domain-containing protein [unclassified Pseudonocardia]OLL76265.1 hypothetical protein Ae150APs1_4643c [Pseudonocardia sp. Ae150A_Ps1]OLL82264.1 hypothetical protein Ae168Ps1_4670c [Pseudonocardia sp. Ae168_Ps1]OLL83620.1 hypothetical protein Ae263Ps1_0675 [Pseudonocardia sp. Ae263_Ps1]OLL90340.1 hypothetical protein Ae356Ps1_0237c [Pseudonocardia sp. Ae356_Ps1]
MNDTAESMTELLGSAARGLSGERACILETLAKHRMLLRHTVDGLSESDARRRPTASALTLAGILKHVEGVETWADVAADPDAERADFAVGPDDTCESLLARYAATAARTDELVTTVDLDVAHKLPPAPWFPGEAWWSARQALAHIVGETAQHSGHADIIRETIDGRRSMG